jgi:hypothetical protein
MRPALRSPLALLLALAPLPARGQAPPPAADPRLAELAQAIPAAAMEATIRRLAGFGTRHTFSDTVSATRGIGAARRWIHAELTAIGRACGGCLEVQFQRGLLRADPAQRIPHDAELVNVVAIQRGRRHPDRYVLVTGHYDSRASGASDFTSDAPGANDDASGTAAVIEVARVLSRHAFDKTIVYAALAGEEQGLLGGHQLARHAREQGWVIEAVLNNDIIGNTRGIGGQADNLTFRIFSEPVPPTESEAERRLRRVTGGEVDGNSRQLARYVHRTAAAVLPAMRPKLVYRLDRFGRGGDHRAFNDLGYAAVRLTEAWEDYTRQHQDLRTENGVAYGDVADAVDFPYAARIAGINAATLAALAWAPPPPGGIRIRAAGGGGSTAVSWQAAPGPVAGLTWSRFVAGTSATLDGILIDDHLFGVASVSAEGNESLVVFAAAGR